VISMLMGNTLTQSERGLGSCIRWSGGTHIREGAGARLCEPARQLLAENERNFRRSEKTQGDAPASQARTFPQGDF
jgi:hypothetical protein